MNFKVIFVLPKMASSTQTHKSISFIWIVWSTLYVYQMEISTFYTSFNQWQHRFKFRLSAVFWLVKRSVEETRKIQCTMVNWKAGRKLDGFRLNMRAISFMLFERAQQEDWSWLFSKKYVRAFPLVFSKRLVHSSGNTVEFVWFLKKI